MLVLIIGLSALQAACSDGDSGSGGTGVDMPAPARVEIDPIEGLQFGLIRSVTVTVYDGDGAEILNAPTTLVSSDATVLEAMADGRVKATGVGTATLTAASGGASGSIEVSVQPRRWSVSAVEAEIPAYTPMTIVLPEDIPVPEAGVIARVETFDSILVVPIGADTLGAIIPDIGTGSRTLMFEPNENHVVEVAFMAISAPPIADPDVAVGSVVAEVETAIDSLVTLWGVTGENMDAATALLAELEAHTAALSDDEKRHLAVFLGAYPGVFEDVLPATTARPLAPSSVGPVDAASLRYLAELVVTMEAIHITATVLSKSWRICTKGPAASWCAAAGAAVAAVLAIRAIQTSNAAERVVDLAFKPADAMLAELLELAPAGLSSLGGAGGPPGADTLALANGDTVALALTQDYRTLQLSDRSQASGLTGDFLDAMTVLVSSWTDWRLLLEQVARDLGREVSLEGIIPEFPDPPLESELAIRANYLAVTGPSNPDVECWAGGMDVLRIVCESDSLAPQSLTMSASYESDFGTQTYTVNGILYPSPVVIIPAAGDEQEAYPGAPLGEPIVVRVHDVRNDVPIAGATVQWTVTSGGGSVAPSSSLTDASGLASTTWTVGDEGEQTLEATVVLEDGSSASDTANFVARADRGAMLQRLDGDDQSAKPGETLADPLVVRVVDQMAIPIEGAVVEWSVSGGGSLSATSTATGANGEASVVWTLGPDADAAPSVEAAYSRDGEHVGGSPVVFTADIWPGDLQLGQLAIRISGAIDSTYFFDDSDPASELYAEQVADTVQPDSTYSWLAVTSSELSFGAAWPGTIEAGSDPLSGVFYSDFRLSDLDRATVAMILNQGAANELQYLATSGTGTIIEGVEPTANRSGVLRGNATFTAREYEPQDDGSGTTTYVATGRTVQVDVAFYLRATLVEEP